MNLKRKHPPLEGGLIEIRTLPPHPRMMGSAAPEGKPALPPPTPRRRAGRVSPEAWALMQITALELLDSGTELSHRTRLRLERLANGLLPPGLTLKAPQE